MKDIYEMSCLFWVESKVLIKSEVGKEHEIDKQKRLVQKKLAKNGKYYTDKYIYV